MKCPKCESEATMLCYTQHDSSEDITTHYQCSNKECLTIFNDKEEERYQQRLDNVLSKLKLENETKDVFHYTKGLLKISYYGYMKNRVFNWKKRIKKHIRTFN